MTVRSRILEAAADLLARSADADVSTRAVADAAGVTAPTLYHHFGDKEGLLSAVVEFGWAHTLMWSPRVARTSAASLEAHKMLYEVFERGAARGQLRVSVVSAARTAMAAVTGAALSLISQPELFGDGAFATQLREAVIAAITVAGTGPSSEASSGAPSVAKIAETAATLSSLLASEKDTPLTEPERR